MQNRRYETVTVIDIQIRNPFSALNLPSTHWTIETPMGDYCCSLVHVMGDFGPP
jgi:hypothetical protein